LRAETINTTVKVKEQELEDHYEDDLQEEEKMVLEPDSPV
jgi:hypothetical protein